MARHRPRASSSVVAVPTFALAGVVGPNVMVCVY